MPPQATHQGAPQYAQRPAQRDFASFGTAPSYNQWPAPAHNGYEQDLGGYLPADTPFPANSNHPGGDPLQQADWAMPAANYGDPSLEQGYGRGGQQAYDQQHGGALEPTYGGQEEAGGYEVDEPRRVSWTMRIAGAVVVAIGLGYGLAQAYKSVLGGPAPDGATPVVSSEATPAKEKPLDPGGKQFSHTDSKVLGRLGDGGSTTAEQPGGLSESDASNGSKKVTTLVVGRDGSIAPPEAGAAEPAAASGTTGIQRVRSRPHRRRRFWQRSPGSAAALGSGRAPATAAGRGTAGSRQRAAEGARQRQVHQGHTGFDGEHSGG